MLSFGKLQKSCIRRPHSVLVTPTLKHFEQASSAAPPKLHLRRNQISQNNFKIPVFHMTIHQIGGDVFWINSTTVWRFCDTTQYGFRAKGLILFLVAWHYFVFFIIKVKVTGKFLCIFVAVSICCLYLPVLSVKAAQTPVKPACYCNTWESVLYLLVNVL